MIEQNISEERMRVAVNKSCTCGGRGLTDPKCCPACQVWHRIGWGDELPPMAMPIVEALQAASDAVGVARYSMMRYGMAEEDLMKEMRDMVPELERVARKGAAGER